MKCLAFYNSVRCLRRVCPWCSFCIREEQGLIEIVEHSPLAAFEPCYERDGMYRYPMKPVLKDERMDPSLQTIRFAIAKIVCNILY